MTILPTIDLMGVLTNINGEVQRKQSEIDHVKTSIRLLCDTEEQYKEALQEITRVDNDRLYPNWLCTAKNWVNERSGGYYGK